jgi:hypothetical protein
MFAYILFYFLLFMSVKPVFANGCQSVFINGTPQPGSVNCHVDVSPNNNEGHVEVKINNNLKNDTSRVPEIITVAVTATPTPTLITYPTYNVKRVVRFTPIPTVELIASPSATRVPTEKKKPTHKPIQQKSKFFQNILLFLRKCCIFSLFEIYVVSYLVYSKFTLCLKKNP